MSPLEIIAVVFGLANIYLTVKQNIWGWAAERDIKLVRGKEAE